MGYKAMRVGQGACLTLWVFSLFCAQSEAAIDIGKNWAVSLVQMETPADVTISTFFVFLAYICQVALLGGAFEMTNLNGFNSPALDEKQRARRKKQVTTEIRTGFLALFVTVLLTVVWMRYGEPRGPFYGYFSDGGYSVGWFLASIVAYVFWFDTWFYWSHRWLHENNWAWHKVHYQHHQFKEPSAFAQFATHPLEAALQGPVGHYMCTLFFPMHPIAHTVMGFLSSAWAVAAHDGRWMDFNSHYFHHSKGRGRLIYFNLGFLTPCWDVLCGTRWHENHPQWAKWKKERGKTVFDTMSGDKGGKANDVYKAYDGKLDGLAPTYAKKAN